ncbi:MAG: hypothetical protein LBD23_14255 [Oscillospiraceae bacterium]|jgi:hypothetical protein|nr:hypothetical protein [Oscillospiraceae bacterium]
MRQIVLNIKDSRKADILLSLLADLDYVDARPTETSGVPESRSQWLNRLHIALDASMDEDISLISRGSEMRPLVTFAD